MNDFESKEQQDFENFMLRYKSEFRDFDKVGDYTYSNTLTGIAYDSYLQGIKSQQAKIDELQAIVYGLKRDQNNLELKAEDAECVSMSLDDQGVAKCDDDGKPYSLWGRVCQFKKSNNITERDLERIYWEFDQERKNSGGERVVFKNTLRSLLNNLKGNKDEN